ncbi:MAG: alpha/beta fold hydrolase [Candidatus Dormibacteria bacterium]
MSAGGPLEIETGGHSFQVLDSGTGPGVLLLHGADSSLHAWDDETRALTEAGMRTVAPGLEVFAGADDVASAVEASRSILRILGLPRVHAVGRGWGAEVAAALTSRHPGRVDRVVLVGWVGEVEGSAWRERRVMLVRDRDESGEETAIAGARVEVMDEASRLSALLSEFLRPDPRPRPGAADSRATIGRPATPALARRLRDR